MSQVTDKTSATPASNNNKEQEQIFQLLNAIAGFKIPKYFISIFLTILYIILTIYFIRVSRDFVKKVVRKINNVDHDNNKDDEFYKRKVETIEVISYNVLKTIVVLLSLILIMSAWGVSIGPILAGAGIMGVSIGFGAQSFLRDIISGFVIMFTGYVNIGDLVEIREKRGRIVDITLSTTILKTEAGDVVYIPNGSIDVITKIK
jgi:small conductance mechanosensitive channel